MAVVRSYLGDAVAFAVMVVMEGCAVGLTIMAKTVMARGMSHFVFVVYSNALATFILLPSFIFHRTKSPFFCFPLLQRFFFLGLTGITVPQNLAFTGLNYSSPILVCGMNNMIPAISFLLSTILRTGKIDIRSSSSQAKSVGTLISIMGAITITMYRGPSMRRPPQPSPIHQLSLSPTKLLIFSSTPEHWVLGSLLLAAASFSVCLWNFIQAETVKEYPEAMNVVPFYSLFGTIQSAVVGLIAERDPSAWRLKSDLELIVIVLSAVVGIVIRSIVQVWCVRLKGPDYMAMFKPLTIAMAVVVGSIFFGDSLHFGSVLGAFTVGVGNYTVLWGQSKEETMEEQGDDMSQQKSTQKVPLLQNQMEV